MNEAKRYLTCHYVVANWQAGLSPYTVKFYSASDRRCSVGRSRRLVRGTAVYEKLRSRLTSRDLVGRHGNDAGQALIFVCGRRVGQRRRRHAAVLLYFRRDHDTQRPLQRPPAIRRYSAAGRPPRRFPPDHHTVTQRGVFA